MLIQGPFPESQARAIHLQILRALAYLHSIEVCHRDVKPENVLLMSNDPTSTDYTRIVLADFGMSAHRAGISACEPVLGTLHGTPEFAAPELLILAKRANARHGNACHEKDGAYTGAGAYVKDAKKQGARGISLKAPMALLRKKNGANKKKGGAVPYGNASPERSNDSSSNDNSNSPNYGNEAEFAAWRRDRNISLCAEVDDDCSSALTLSYNSHSRNDTRRNSIASINSDDQDDLESREGGVSPRRMAAKIVSSINSVPPFPSHEPCGISHVIPTDPHFEKTNVQNNNVRDEIIQDKNIGDGVIQDENIGDEVLGSFRGGMLMRTGSRGGGGEVDADHDFRVETQNMCENVVQLSSKGMCRQSETSTSPKGDAGTRRQSRCHGRSERQNEREPEREREEHNRGHGNSTKTSSTANTRHPCSSMDQDGYTCLVDIWAAGAVLYVMLSAHTPFCAKGNIPHMVKKIIHGRYDFRAELWRDVSEEAKDMIRSMMVVSPHSRPTAAQCLKHPFVSRHPQHFAHRADRRDRPAPFGNYDVQGSSLRYIDRGQWRTASLERMEMEAFQGEFPISPLFRSNSSSTGQTQWPLPSHS
jgi:serine/threonine protein kinase